MLNLALRKPALQSSVSRYSIGRTLAEDAKGGNNGYVSDPYGFHTATERDPWWQVDLEDSFHVHRLVIFNRSAQADRLRHFTVLGSHDGREWEELFRKTDDHVFGRSGEPFTAEIAGAPLVRFVRVRLDGEAALHFRECQVFGEHPDPAIRARMERVDVSEMHRTSPTGESFADRMIRQHVSNLSFVDVGALWLTRNEKISVAMLAGAKSASIIDTAAPGDPAWARCREHCRSLGVSGYAEYSHDVNDPLIHKTVGTFDFVYCSGVLYHMPSVFFTLQRLFSLSNRYLVLVSMVVPETIENEFGTIDLGGGGMLFVPGLNEARRKILNAYWSSKGLQIMHITPTEYPVQSFTWQSGAPNYAPWWWLFPVRTLCSLVETAGFKIIATNPSWGDRGVSVFCER